MGDTAAYLISIAAICFIMLFFAYKTPGILSKMAAGISLLSLMFYLLDSDHSLSMTEPWVIIMVFSVVCMTFAVLISYMRYQINDYGILASKAKDKRSKGEIDHDNYIERLNSIGHGKRSSGLAKRKRIP